jgi:phage head maturation protease
MTSKGARTVFHQRNINALDRTVTRLRDFMPTSFDDSGLICEATISTGSPVKREYGLESLEISKAAVDLSRLLSVGIPLLDSHQQTSIVHSLGRVTSARVRNGALLGMLQFNRTREGEKAAGMVWRGEISGISAGYRVETWTVTDSKGRVIDPENTLWGDDDLQFVGTRWELLECSLVAIAADLGATVRSEDDRAYIAPRPACADVEHIHARMGARSRMMSRVARLNSGQKHYPPMTFFASHRNTASIFMPERRDDRRPSRLVDYGRR